MSTDVESPKSHKRDWVELLLKIATPLITGVVIAGIGLYSNKTLRELSENEENARTIRAHQAELARAALSSREESARLITELQVQREQAETDLRKDVFDQALAALFNKNQDDGSFQHLSKRLLRLELLALNFGDSLSLSPLFSEFKRDLDYSLSVNTTEADYSKKIGTLKNRLLGLAKRVASGQLSSLSQHGHAIGFVVPLDRKEIEKQDCPGADKLMDKGNDYFWPDAQIEEDIRGSKTQLQQDTPGISKEELDAWEAKIRKGFAKNILKLDGVRRHITIAISNVDRCKKTVTVRLSIEREDPPTPVLKDIENFDDAILSEGERTTEVEREFQLDFYNFPVVDNTRLSHNHRFAIVMEDFNVNLFSEVDPQIAISGVVFPAEYASLRDRPGMEEAMQLLQSALHLKNTPSSTKHDQEIGEKEE